MSPDFVHKAKSVCDHNVFIVDMQLTAKTQPFKILKRSRAETLIQIVSTNPKLSEKEQKYEQPDFFFFFLNWSVFSPCLKTVFSSRKMYLTFSEEDIRTLFTNDSYVQGLTLRMLSASPQIILFNPHGNCMGGYHDAC